MRRRAGAPLKPFRRAQPASSSARSGWPCWPALLLAAFQLDDLPLIGGGTGLPGGVPRRERAGRRQRGPGRRRQGRQGHRGRAGPGRRPARTCGSSSGVDDDVRLGARHRATIRIKTVLGQKYLALEPAGPGRLAEDAEIPLDRTASPFDVVQAVTGLAGTPDASTRTARPAFTVLSETFADTPPACGRRWPACPGCRRPRALVSRTYTPPSCAPCLHRFGSIRV